MRILIDINHPKNVHIFKNLAKHFLNQDQYEVQITCMSKDLTVDLLNEYKLPFKVVGRHRTSVFGKLLNLLVYTVKIIITITKYKPDVCISQGSVYLAIACKLTNTSDISLHDTDNAGLNNLISLNFSKFILTSKYFNVKVPPKKHIQFNGILENAYLHPNYISEFQSDSLRNVIYIRFVSWGATHDYGHQGLSQEEKIIVVKTLNKYGEVVISSEGKLPQELNQYKSTIKPSLIHSYMAKVKLFIGESATMAAECALLGIHSIYIDNVGRSYTDFLGKEFDLVRTYSEDSSSVKQALSKAEEILCKDNISYFLNKKQKYFNHTIDLTKLLIFILEDFPNNCVKTVGKVINRDINI